MTKMLKQRLEEKEIREMAEQVASNLDKDAQVTDYSIINTHCWKRRFVIPKDGAYWSPFGELRLPIIVFGHRNGFGDLVRTLTVCDVLLALKGKAS